MARRDARQRRAVLGGGVEDEHARRPVGVRAEVGGPLGPSEVGQGRRHRGEVLADIVAPEVDEVARPEPEPLGHGARLVGPARERSGAERVRGSSGERNDPDPFAPDVQQAACRLGDRVRPDEDRRRIAQQSGPQPLAEPRQRSALEGLGISHGARSSRVTTVGSREAIGRPPPAAW